MLKNMKKLCVMLISLALVLGMMPGLASSASADAGSSSAAFFTVYTQSRTGEPAAVKTYTKAEFSELASTGRNGYLYYKGDNDWSVWGVTKYVSIDKLLEDAGVELTDTSVMQTNASDGYTYTVDNNVISKSGEYFFFPKAAKGSTSTEGAVTVPACIGINWDGGYSIDENKTAGDKAEELCSSSYDSGNLRLFYGSTTADYTSLNTGSDSSIRGARSVSNMTGLTVLDKGDADCTVKFMQSDTKPWTTKYFKSGEKLILPSSEPENAGYDFDYWYYKDSSGNEVKADTDTVVSGNMTIYPKWSESHTWSSRADTSWYNTSDTTFTITTPQQLAGLARIVNGTATDASGKDIAQDDFTGKTVLLGNDLSMGDTCYTARDTTNTAMNWTPIGHVEKYSPVGYDENGLRESGNNWSHFAGTFDGQGHVIKNLYCVCPSSADLFNTENCYIGLFGNLTGTVQYLGVTGYVDAARISGGIAAYNNGLILGCRNDCTVVGNGSGTRPSGGIAGLNDGSIVYSYNSGSVSNQCETAGGIAGGTKYAGSLISNCFNTGRVCGGTSKCAGAITDADCDSTSSPLGTVSNCYWLADSNGYVYENVFYPENCATTCGYAAATEAYKFSTDGSITGRQKNSSCSDTLGSSDPTTLLGGINSDGENIIISAGGTFRLFWEADGFDYDTWKKNDGTSTVAIADTDNGTTSASATGSVKSGSVIKVTAKPDKGYKASSFTVTYKDGDNVTGTWTKKTGSTNGSEQSITIPAFSDISVRANYEAFDNDISKGTLTVSDAALTYNGEAQKPAVTLKDENGNTVDPDQYDVTYENNTAAGTAAVTATAKADGYYTGKKAGTFKISAAEIKADAIKAVPDQTYTGHPITPGLTAAASGMPLTAGRDYDAVYSSNTDAGTATVKITAKGNYTGTAEQTFTIVPAELPANAIAAIADKVYTGKAQIPALTVTAAGMTLNPGTDYTAAYSSNIYTGKASVKIAGKGNFTGAALKTFSIRPAGSSISRLAKGKRKFTVTIKSQAAARVSGYQITYRKSPGKWKSVRTGALKKTVSGLSKSKKYYVKVRAYKIIDGRYAYGAYSGIKAVRVK